MSWNFNEFSIDVSEFSEEDQKIIKLIFKKNGNVRKSKPKIEYELFERNGRQYRVSNYETGCAAYVWRMLMFNTQSIHPHCCMPVMADCDLPYKSGEREKRKELIEAMDNLTDRILAKIPKEKWKGVIRWGRALGAI